MSHILEFMLYLPYHETKDWILLLFLYFKDSLIEQVSSGREATDGHCQAPEHVEIQASAFYAASVTAVRMFLTPAVGSFLVHLGL